MKLCFVALSAYPLLSGKNLEYILGSDVHQVLLAKELVKNGFKVSFITYDEGGPPVEYVNDMEVIKTYSKVNRPNLASKIFCLWKAMKKANADVYVQLGGAGGVTPLFCRLNRKRFVTIIGSDAYVRKEIKDWGVLFRLSSELEIRLANVIIVQSEFQKAMLKKNFGRDSLIIKNPFPLNVRKAPRKLSPRIILWVGSVNKVKQPELFLKLAKLIPEAKFQMIAARGVDNNYYRVIEEASRSIPNLDFFGFIPFDKINQYFERAYILINTSKFEGFPNAFIQAWMNYTPVVSLNVDPDEIICRYKLGFHSRTLDQLIVDVRTLLNNVQLHREMSNNGRQYVEREHNITNVVRQFIEACLKL